MALSIVTRLSCLQHSTEITSSPNKQYNEINKTIITRLQDPIFVKIISSTQKKSDIFF